MSGLPSVGTDFGPFRIVRRLGRGGMGVVFLAEQPGLGRNVALKVLAPQFAEQVEFRERFHREATALAKLSASHVVHVYDFGEYDGCLFIAMQFVEGEDLGGLISRGPLSVQVALDICGQVADGLVEAHRAGIVHRDIKPKNVLLDSSGDSIRAYLCDFGIARTASDSHTQTGSVVGTYGFMAPEQCLGERATETSDVYALGCLLVACLSGKAPFGGSDISVANQHLSADRPSWPGQDPLVLGLNHLISRLMDVDPRSRIQTAQEAKAAIDVVRQLASTPVTSTPVSASLESSTILRKPVPPPVPAPNLTQIGNSSSWPSAAAPAKQFPAWGWVAVVVACFLFLASVGVVGFVFLGGEPDKTQPTSKSNKPATGENPSAPIDDPAVTRSPTGGIPENPLDLSATYANLPCNDQYVVMLGTTGLPEEYHTKLPESIRGVVDAKYLRASESCGAFKIKTGQYGDPVFNTYAGPYPDLESACRAFHSMTDYQDTAWVRQVKDGAPDRVLCMCLRSPQDLPIANPANLVTNPSDKKYVSDMQWVLYKMGYNNERRLSGNHSEATRGMLQAFQEGVGAQHIDGILGPATWQALQKEWCNQQ